MKCEILQGDALSSRWREAGAGEMNGVFIGRKLRTHGRLVPTGTSLSVAPGAAAKVVSLRKLHFAEEATEAQAG